MVIPIWLWALDTFVLLYLAYRIDTVDNGMFILKYTILTIGILSLFFGLKSLL